MDTFENTQQPAAEQPVPEVPVSQPEPVAEAAPQQEPVAEAAPQQEPVPVESIPRQAPVREEGIPYRGTGAGRKESPFANSPYVMPHLEREPQQPPRQAPQSAPRPAQEPAQQPYQRTYYYEPEQPAAPRKPKAKKPKGFWKKPLAAVLALALVIGSCAVTAGIVNSGWQKRTALMEEEFNDRLGRLEEQLGIVSQKADHQISLGAAADGSLMTPAQVYAENVDTVVMVYSTVIYNSYGQPTTGTSTGSGFIISKDGFILTNHHVIEGATEVSVVTHGGEEYKATIIGSDSTNDIALLKVEGRDLPVAELGSSDALTVGDQVVAIGNPLGELTSTMTVGYVSGKERAVTTDGATIDMIQTDAAINSGNSGGPLFNMLGQVVGITTAKYSGESASGASIEGIGFAIPMDDVMEVVEDLVEFGYVKSAYMGITVLDLDASLASMYNLPVGVFVQSVEPGGPAAAAGMQAEDIIIRLGDKNITNYNDLARALREYEPGDTTTVVVFRSGVEWNLTITLTERPQDADASQPSKPDNEMPSEGSYEDWYKYFEPFFGKGNGGE